MKRIALLAVTAAAGWVLTPIIDATIRGTIDDRTLAGMRSGHGASMPEVDLPGPRRPSEDEHVASGQGVA